MGMFRAGSSKEIMCILGFLSPTQLLETIDQSVVPGIDEKETRAVTEMQFILQTVQKSLISIALSKWVLAIDFSLNNSNKDVCHKQITNS